MNVSDERINLWAKPIGDTEEEKCQSAIRQITDVMRERFGNSVKIIHQGSHANRTNVRADSDVDIAVVYEDSYFSDVEWLPADHQTHYWNALVPATYSFEQFKKDTHDALVKKFGLLGVSRKNKCIRVAGNSTRINADVVPAFRSNRYSALGVVAHRGIGFITDNDKKLTHSFPEQHYDSGVSKNEATSTAFKAAVRVLKNTRNEMTDKGIIVKDSMPSFFLESLVWNAGNHHFTSATYREDARAVAAAVWNDMRVLATAQNYKEVSELKWLLREAHRTPAQAELFMHRAWNYLEP